MISVWLTTFFPNINEYIINYKKFQHFIVILGLLNLSITPHSSLYWCDSCKSQCGSSLLYRNKLFLAHYSTVK